MPSVAAEVQSGELRAFLKAIGDPRPVEAFRQETVPPTFLYCLFQLWSESPNAVIDVVGLNGLAVLHASQSFEYFGPVRLGGEVHFTAVVGKPYEKRGGTRVFIPVEVTARDCEGRTVCEMSQLLVVVAS